MKMIEMPTLAPCPKCGKYPEWFYGWKKYTGDYYASGLWLYCDCHTIEKVLSAIPTNDEATAAVNEAVEEWCNWLKEAEDG